MGHSTFAFRHNTILDTAIYPVSEQPSSSRAGLVLDGNSPAKKFFQGNRTPKGEYQFHTSNLPHRRRYRCRQQSVPRHPRPKSMHPARAANHHPGKLCAREYSSRSLMPTGARSPRFTSGKGTLAEHNVIRDGEWIVPVRGRRFRYNLLADHKDHQLHPQREQRPGKVHHNIFFTGNPPHVAGSENELSASSTRPRRARPDLSCTTTSSTGAMSTEAPASRSARTKWIKSMRNNVYFRFKLTPKQSRPCRMRSILSGARQVNALYRLQLLLQSTGEGPVLFMTAA